MFRGKKNWNIKGYLMKKLINKDIGNKRSAKQKNQI